MTLATAPQHPLENRLLALLPGEDYERLLPYLNPVTFALGDVLYELGRAMNYLYFPTSAIASLIYTTAEGTTADMGLVGNQGVVGIALFMGGNTTPNQAIVQVAGGAFRLQAQALHTEFRRGGPLQLALLRYTQALLTQISQTAVWRPHYHPRPPGTGSDRLRELSGGEARIRSPAGAGAGFLTARRRGVR